MNSLNLARALPRLTGTGMRTRPPIRTGEGLNRWARLFSFLELPVPSKTRLVCEPSPTWGPYPKKCKNAYGDQSAEEKAQKISLASANREAPPCQVDERPKKSLVRGGRFRKSSRKNEKTVAPRTQNTGARDDRPGSNAPDPISRHPREGRTALEHHEESSPRTRERRNDTRSHRDRSRFF